MPLVQKAKSFRHLTHAYHNRRGIYVILIANGEQEAARHEGYVGPLDNLRRYDVTSCDTSEEGANSYHLYNGTHPIYVSFPERMAASDASISYHQEMSTPEIEAIYHANVDMVVSRLGDVGRGQLDIDCILPQPKVG